MGHIGATNLQKLPSMCNGVILNEEQKDISNCKVCVKAKTTKLPHNTIRVRATRPLEIIHSDLVGPIRPATFDKKRYFMTFLDDFTHYAVVCLLQTKDEAF